MIASSGAVGCAFQPPTRELLGHIGRIEAPAGPVRRADVTVTLDSDRWSGVFTGVLVARPGRNPAVRLQLYPDLGNKILDLVASPTEIAAETDGAETLRTPRPPDGALEPSLPLLLAVTLLEYYEGIDAERVTGVRRRGPWWNRCWEIRLTPHDTGVEQRVRLDDEFRVLSRRFRYGPAQWQLRGDDTLVVSAWGLSCSIERNEVERLDDVPDIWFELPAGAAP